MKEKKKKYVGICACCFNPVLENELMKFSELGRNFHSSCAEENPNSYYVAIERIRRDFSSGVNKIKLMDQMESIFSIPMLNDLQFNAENKEVIDLYREISDSRINK